MSAPSTRRETTASHSLCSSTRSSRATPGSEGRADHGERVAQRPRGPAWTGWRGRGHAVTRRATWPRRPSGGRPPAVAVLAGHAVRCPSAGPGGRRDDILTALIRSARTRRAIDRWLSKSVTASAITTSPPSSARTAWDRSIAPPTRCHVAHPLAHRTLKSMMSCARTSRAPAAPSCSARPG